MNSQIDISGISFIDVLLVIILIWAVYKGFKRGPLVQSLSLLVIIAGIAVFGLISTELADFISGKWKGSVHRLDSYIFAVLFSATVWLSNIVADKTENASSVNLKKPVNIILGIVAAVVKYLYITGIILLFVSQSGILPLKQERKSRFYKTVKNTAPSTMKTVSFLK